MAYSALGELLIVFLLIVSSGRIFFLKYERIDTLAALAPAAFIISILQILAWNADIISVSLFVLSALAVITNIHALSRSAARLYVDHYSPVFIIFSVIVLLASVSGAVVIFRFAPVNVKPSDFGVSEKKLRMAGTFESGFIPAASFERSSADVYVYARTDGAAKNKTVILGCDKRGDAANYRPYMILLAKEGYTVITCDFYAEDGRWFTSPADWKYFRRFAMLIEFISQKTAFMKQKEFYTFGMMREFRAMETIAEKLFPGNGKYFLVSDVMGDTAAKELRKQNPRTISGMISLDSVMEYKTPGFGCVEQTDPLTAWYFGCSRDAKLFIPRYLVLQTVKAMGEK